VARPLLRALAASLGCAWLVAATWSATQGDEPAEWQLAEPAPVAELRTQVHPAWREVSCAQCHEEIAREWGASLHALAWNDEVYQDELSSVRRKKSCHGCHAPQPLLGTDLSARPQVRTMWQHHGVDCRSCHLGPDGAIHGPHGAPSSGHTSVADEAFVGAGSNAMCISCHRVSIGPVIGIAKDFEEEALAGRGMSCVGCHMAPVERSMAVDDYTGEPLPPRSGRSHALQTPRDPAFLAQAFRLEAERTDQGALLRVHNRAGHRVPGLEDRRMVFEVELLDASGEVLAGGELIVSRREYLPFGEFSELSLEGVGGARLRVQATHDAASLKAPVQFLERQLELPD
jgi:nitrate/TMAO reductase-like tetraheme cytochrome c subunit